MWNAIKHLSTAVLIVAVLGVFGSALWSVLADGEEKLRRRGERRAQYTECIAITNNATKCKEWTTP